MADDERETKDRNDGGTRERERSLSRQRCIVWLHSDDIECLFRADDVVNDFFIFKGKFKYMKRVISARFSHDVIESTAVKRTKPLEGLFFAVSRIVLISMQWRNLSTERLGHTATSETMFPLSGRHVLVCCR